MKKDSIHNYLAKYAIDISDIDYLPPPAAELKMVIVIPALAERYNLPEVLSSLKYNKRLAEAEVIVVVNNSSAAVPEIIENNLATLEDIKKYRNNPLKIYSVDKASLRKSLNPAEIGVGLVRRIGMDLALSRLYSNNRQLSGVIACLDADSPVAPGYIDNTLKKFFSVNPPLGAICDYEHTWDSEPELVSAINIYELWLRYFELGLKLSGSLFAVPTIGSCLIVSALGYALARGMPVRKAGEDFHFLRNLIKVSGYQPLLRLKEAKVFPKARISSRVLFGTGRAMQRCVEEGLENYFMVASPEIFFELKLFFKTITENFNKNKIYSSEFSPVFKKFLEHEQAWKIISRLKNNYTQKSKFQLALQHWFDSLRIVRYVNFHAKLKGKVEISNALKKILENLDQADSVNLLPALNFKQLNLQAVLTWLKYLRNFE